MKAKRIVLVSPFIHHDPDMGSADYLMLRGPISVNEIIQKLNLLSTCFEFVDNRQPLYGDDDVYSAVEDLEWLFIPPYLP